MTTLKNSMLKKGKKGFTLTELAIVIAVIAILIAVLVPTFTSVITKARLTTAAEEAKNSITAYVVETTSEVPDGTIVESGDYYFTVSGGTVTTDSDAYSDSNNTTATYAYTWQDEDNKKLPVMYFTSEYVAEHYSLHGFSATAVETAANSASASNTYVYAKVTVGSNTYYYSLAKDTTYSATYQSSNKQTTIVASEFATVNGFAVQLYITATGSDAATTAATAVADVVVDSLESVLDQKTVYYVKITDAGSTVYYFSVSYSSGWSATTTTESYGTASGTAIDMSATTYETYTVEYKTSTQATADATADAALAAFEADGTYGVSTNTVVYIAVGDTNTSYYSVSGSTITLLTSTLDVSSYTSTTAYYHSSGSGSVNSSSPADATIYYSSSNN